LPSVADLVEDIVATAAGDVARRGRELAGRVQIDALGPIRVVARVTDLAEHHVVLLARRDGLDWECDCEDAKRAMCAHVVATALVAHECAG
jgi:hypothetical protein